MTSRRRPREGLHRVDAAYSVLCPMGFPKTLVRQTINSLLKVYGGMDGWSFIEDASYRLVVETILEEQEKGEVENGEQEKGEVENGEQNSGEGSTPEVESLGQSDNPNTQHNQDRPPCNQSLAADEAPEGAQSQHTNSDHAPMDIAPCQTQDSLKEKAAAEKRTQYPSRLSGPAAGLRSRKKHQSDNPNTLHIQDKPPCNQSPPADKSPEGVQFLHTNSDHAPMDIVPSQTQDSLNDKEAAEKCTQLMFPGDQYPSTSSRPTTGIHSIKKRQSDNPKTQHIQDKPMCNQSPPADKSPGDQSQHTNSDQAPMDIVPGQTQDSLKDKAAAEKHTPLMLPGVQHPTGLRSMKKRQSDNPNTQHIQGKPLCNQSLPADKAPEGAQSQHTNYDHAPMDIVPCQTENSLKDKATAEEHTSLMLPGVQRPTGLHSMKKHQSDNPNTQHIQDRPPCNQSQPADKSRGGAQSQHTNSDRAPMEIVPCQTQDSLKDKAAAEKRTPLMLSGVQYPSRCSGPATGLHSIKKRRPCYGWISWEDEEEAAAYLSRAP